MSILIGNKPIDEYYHESHTYVEGRKGSEYTIRLKNHSDSRACFVVSVDGLSILNGQEAGNDSPGYVVDARKTLDVACYKVDDATGARFTFGGKDKSYSAEVGKGTDNVGVIAALVFQEKARPPLYYPLCYPLHVPHPYPYTPWHHRYGTSIASNSGGGWNTSIGTFNSNSVRTQSNSTCAAPDSAGRGIAPEVEVKTIGGGVDFEQEALGTSFGRSMDWRTQTVAFERASDYPNATIVLFYDNKKNLERRGIEFKKKVPPLPNPFPGNGCPVPGGWRK